MIYLYIHIVCALIVWLVLHFEEEDQCADGKYSKEIAMFFGMLFAPLTVILLTWFGIQYLIKKSGD